MHRAIIEAWLPWLGCLLAAAVLLRLLMRAGGGRLDLRKLRSLHRCEAGSVQTLSFVLTLPLFIMLLMFIVQVAELMVGIAVIHYAAFAAGRSAIVWFPADVSIYEPANTIDHDSMDVGLSVYPNWLTKTITFDKYDDPTRNFKYRKVWTTAALACVPLAPSRDLQAPSKATYLMNAVQQIYPTLVPSSAGYPRGMKVIEKKIAYSCRNTWIEISGIDNDAANGPTYNPYPSYTTYERDPDSGAMHAVTHPYNGRQIGWEDPLTVTVWHNFALLPGPGRFLAIALKPDDGSADRVSPFIEKAPNESYKNPDRNVKLYIIVLQASVTLTNEGLKSVMPYAQPID